MARLGGPTSDSRWRLSVGTALVSGGLLAVGLGAANVFNTVLVAAGVGTDTAWWVGVGAAAVLVPTLIVAMSTQLDTPTPYRRGLSLGVGIAILGAVLVVTVAATVGTPTVVMVAAIPYAGGVVLALWSVVAGAATGPRPTASISYQAEDSTTESQPSAADGGEEDSLSFPFDDDR